MSSRYYIAPEARLEQAFDPEELKFFQGLRAKFSGEIIPADIVPVFISVQTEGWQSLFAADQDLCSNLYGLRALRPMIWGFPNWAKMGMDFNLRWETDLDQEIFSDSLRNRRVAAPATGFIQRTSAPPGHKKSRSLFTLPGHKLLFMAGMWASFPNPLNGRIPPHFTILTTRSNDSLAPYHHRMPVILADGEVDDWLAGDDFHKYLEREQSDVMGEQWKC